MTCAVCGGMGVIRVVDENGETARDSNGQFIYRKCLCRVRAEAEHLARDLRAASGISDSVYERFTLDNWNPSAVRSPRCHPAAILETCRRYAAHPDGWLVLMGPVGVGKTHLAYALAGELLRRAVPVYAANVPAMLAMIRAGYGDGGMLAEQRIDQLRSIQVLVLDDWGTERATDWASETLFTVLDARYLNRLPTVVTTNLPLPKLAAKGDRLASRLMDRDLSQVVVLDAGDYRQRA